LVDEVETVQPTKHARTAKAGMSIVKEDLAIIYYATVFLSIFKTGAVPKKISRSKKAKVEEEEVIEERRSRRNGGRRVGCQLSEMWAISSSGSNLIIRRSARSAPKMNLRSI
jgi:hypothetical protein